MSNIIVDPGVGLEDEEKVRPSEALVSWVIPMVTEWRHVRDTAYKDKWDDWYNTLRGRWTANTKNKKKERSMLISPLSIMAVDLTVADIVEGVFGRENFIDLPDDVADEQKDDMEQTRQRLKEDMMRDGFLTECIKTFWCGTVYGTGIMKVNVDVAEERTAQQVKVVTKGEESTQMVSQKTERVKVYASFVEPGQFSPDPAAAMIPDMLGAIHEFRMPLHKVWARQKAKTYIDIPVGVWDWEPGTENRGEEFGAKSTNSTWALISEYHGKVPKHLMLSAMAEQSDSAAPIEAASDRMELIDAIITIANEGELLRAIPNPSVMGDSAFDAYQHDTIPNRFWGRGVMEKGHHPQKGMDAELRARADSLAWINNPMLAGDLTKMPPKTNLNVWPGRFFGFKGNPKEALQEFRFGDVNASTWQQEQSFSRQHQQATGAIDPAGMGAGVRDQATGATAMNMSGIVKRSKRTMYNIEDFLGSVVRKVLWRKMQFEPDRYSADFKFQVKGAIGIMAREMEQAFLVNLLQTTQPGTPTHLLILKGIFENSSTPARGELLKAVDAMLEPPSKEEQEKQRKMEEAQMQMVIEEVRNKRADTALKLAQGDAQKATALLKETEASFIDDEVLVKQLGVTVDIKTAKMQDRQVELSSDKLDLERDKLDQQKKEFKAGD